MKLRGEQNIWAETIGKRAIRFERMLNVEGNNVYYARPAFVEPQVGTLQPAKYKVDQDLERLRASVKILIDTGQW